MDIAHDLDTVIVGSVENQVIPHRKMPYALSDVVPRHSEVRIVGECTTLYVEDFKKAIRRSLIKARDVIPDFEQIEFCAPGSTQAWHAPNHACALNVFVRRRR